MILRNMTSDDYDGVFALWMNTSGVGLSELDDTRDGITKYLRRNPGTSFVAEKDGAIVGVILCGHDGRRGYIYHTAVAEAERGTGVGTALVEAAVRALEREGINKAALVAFSSNVSGNAFWMKRGFTERTDLIYRNKAIRKPSERADG